MGLVVMRGLRGVIVLALLVVPTLVVAPPASALTVGETLLNVSALPSPFTFRDLDGSLRLLDQVHTAQDNATTTIIEVQEDAPVGFRIRADKTWVDVTKGFVVPKFEVKLSSANSSWMSWVRVAPRVTSTNYEVFVSDQLMWLTDTVSVRITDEAVPWDLESLLGGGRVYGLGDAGSVIVDRAEGLWWTATSDRGNQSVDTFWNESVNTTVPIAWNETGGNRSYVWTNETRLPNGGVQEVEEWMWTNATEVGEGNTTLTTQHSTRTTITQSTLSLKFSPAFGRENYGATVRVNKSWLASQYNVTTPVFEWGHGTIAWKPLTITETAYEWQVTPTNFSTITINEIASGTTVGSIVGEGELNTFEEAIVPFPMRVPNGTAQPTWPVTLEQDITANTYWRQAFVTGSGGRLSTVQGNWGGSTYGCDREYIYDVAVYSNNGASPGAMVDRSAAPFIVSGDGAEHQAAIFKNGTMLSPGTKYWAVFTRIQTVSGCSAGGERGWEVKAGGTTCQFSNNNSTWTNINAGECSVTVNGVSSTVAHGVTNHAVVSLPAVQTGVIDRQHLATYNPWLYVLTDSSPVTVTFNPVSTGLVSRIDLAMGRKDNGQCQGASTLGQLGLYQGSTLLAKTRGHVMPGRGLAFDSYISLIFEPAVSLASGTTYSIKTNGVQAGCGILVGGYSSDQNSNVGATGGSVWAPGCGACTQSFYEPSIKVWRAEYAQKGYYEVAVPNYAAIQNVLSAKAGAYNGSTPSGTTANYVEFTDDNWGTHKGASVGGVAVPLSAAENEFGARFYLNTTNKANTPTANPTITVRARSNWGDVTTRAVGANSESNVVVARNPIGINFTSITGWDYAIPVSDNAMALAQSREYGLAGDSTEVLSEGALGAEKSYFNVAGKEVLLRFDEAASANSFRYMGVDTDGVTEDPTLFRGAYYDGLPTDRKVTAICANYHSGTGDGSVLLNMQVGKSNPAPVVSIWLVPDQSQPGWQCVPVDVAWPYGNALVYASAGTMTVNADYGLPFNGHYKSGSSWLPESNRRGFGFVLSKEVGSINDASANMTWGTDYDITVPAFVPSGGYVMAQGRIRDVNGVGVDGYEVNMSIVYGVNSTKIPCSGIVCPSTGPSYAAVGGNYLGVMATNYLSPGQYKMVLEFTDGVNDVTSKKSWPLTIGNNAVIGGGGGGVNVYADGVFYYNFFDSRGGAGLTQDFYKFYLSPDTSIGEEDRVYGGSVPVVVGNRYYLAVKDYYDHVVFPVTGQYSCQGGAGQSCPIDGVVSGSYAYIDVERPQTMMDVGITLYQLKIKNTQSDPAYVTATANSKAFTTWVLPQEVVTQYVPTDTYSIQVDTYDKNLVPPQIKNYAYNYTGSRAPYWMPTSFGVSAQPSAPDGCLDNSLAGTYCSQGATQTETLTYFGTLDLNDVAKLTNVSLYFYDNDARYYYNFKVEVSADPEHEGWFEIFDGTGAGSGWATRTGTTQGTTNKDYRAEQVLSFPYPVDVRYIRVYATGNTVNAGAHIERVWAGTSSSAVLNADNDVFMWIRGYDLPAVVFDITNVGATVYDQIVNVGVNINNQDSTIQQQTVDIQNTINNANSNINTQTTYLSSRINNTNTNINTQTTYLGSVINNTNSNINTQTAWLSSVINNTNSNINSQTVLLGSYINNTNVSIKSQTVLLGSYINQTNAHIGTQTTFIANLVNNSNASIHSQTTLLSNAVNNSNANINSQTTLLANSINNSNANINQQTSFIANLVNNTNAQVASQTNYIVNQINNTNSQITTQVNAIRTEVQNNGIRPPIDASVLAYWSFDDAEGTTARDVTGNGYDLTLHTSPAGTNERWADGHDWGALEFVNDDAKAMQYGGLSQAVADSGKWSVSTWVYLDSWRAADFISTGNHDAGAQGGWAFGIGGAAGTLNLWSSTTGTQTNVGGATKLPLGAWVHVAMTLDSGRNYKLYLNGVLDGSGTLPTMPSRGGSYVAIGQEDQGVDSEWWLDGRLDEMRVYRRVLGPGEVEALSKGVNPALFNQVNFLESIVANSNSTIHNQLNGIYGTINNSETNIRTQVSAVQASIVTQNSNLTNQLNGISSSVVTQNSNLTNQFNSLSQSVTNTNTNLTTQVNTLLSSILNNRTTITDQLNAITTTISNNHATLTSQTNLIQSAIVTQNSNLTNQLNNMQSQVVNTQLRGQVDASTIAYWPMDEYNGSTLNDAGPMGNDATLLAGGPVRVKGVYGDAIWFDGVNDYASWMPNGLIGSNGPYSIGLWFKPEELGRTQTLVGLDGTSRPVLNFQSNNKLLMYAQSSSYLYGTYTFTSNDLNKWHHVVAVVDNPNDESTWHMILNGVDDHTSASTSGVPEVVTSGGYLGRGEGYYKGALDEVRIVNRAVTLDEAKAWYDGIAPGILNQVNVIRADIQNSDASITAQVNYVSSIVNNTNANVHTQVNNVWATVNNTNTNVVDQANIIRANIVTQNANLTNQFNAVDVAITNTKTNINTQLNQVWFTVNNSASNLTSQTNLIQAQVVNQNTNISTQFNLVQNHITNTETNITTQTNLIQAHISNVESNLSSQTNGVNITIQNVNATMLSQFNGVLTTIQNTNLSIQEQTNLIMARVVNEFAARESISRDGLVLEYTFEDQGQGVNLVGNGGFEDYVTSPGLPAGWAARSGSPTVTRVVTNPSVQFAVAEGLNAVNISASGSGQARLYQTIAGLVPGRSYELTAWSKSGNGGKAFLEVDDGGTSLGAPCELTNAFNSWAKSTVVWRAVAGHTYQVELGDCAGTPGAGAFTIWDRVVVREVAAKDTGQNVWHADLMGATTTPGPVFVDGYNGGTGLTFDGVDDHAVVVQSPIGPAPTGGFSIGTWFKSPSGGSDEYLVAVVEGLGASRTSHVGLSVTSGGAASFASRGTGYGTSKSVGGGSGLHDGAWHQLVGVVDAGGLMHLYIDGVEVGTPTSVATLSGLSTVALGAEYTAGGGDSGNPSDFFGGTLDNVRIYTRALGADEITAQYLGVNQAILTQMNLISAGVDNSNTSITNQINAFQSNVNNQYSSLTGQVNVVQAQVVNQNTNLTTQTNQVLASVANTNTNITTQVNAVSTKITNTQTSINGQTNILNVAINNTASMLGDQYNDLQVQVLNTQLRGQIDASTIGYWAMDEYNGTTLKDAGPMGNDASLWNGATRVKGVYGDAVRFDGVNDYASWTPNGLIGDTGTYSVGFWFKPEELGRAQSIVGLDGTGYPVVNLQSNNQLLMYAQANSWAYGPAFTSADLNKWHHVVAVVDNPADETTWRVYVNGVDRTTNFGTSGAPEPVTSNGRFGYGPGGYYKGALDEVRIVNRSITVDEAEAWYDGLAPGVLNQVNSIRADISNSDASITAQVNYVGVQVNNFESNVTNQVNSVLSSVANTNSNVVTQANIITASLVNQNTNLTNQFNSVMTNIQNRNTNISTQVNSVFSRVENIETNLSSQVNTVKTQVVNQNTNISTQVNLIQTHLTNTETNITTQTNLIQAHISNVESNLTTQTNGVNISISNVNATMLSQFNGVLTTIQNTNLSIQEQTNLFLSRVVNEFNAQRNIDPLTLAHWAMEGVDAGRVVDETPNDVDLTRVPAQQFVKNPSWTNYTGGYTPGWDVSLNGNLTPTDGFSSGYNGGVPNPTVGYHAHLNATAGVDGGPAMEFKDLNGQFGQLHRWLGTSQILGDKASDLGWGNGTKVTVSMLARTDAIGKVVRPGLYHYEVGNPNPGFFNNITDLAVGLNWTRVSSTFTIDEKWNLSRYANLYIYGNYGGVEGTIWVDDIQVETNGQRSEFVNWHAQADPGISVVGAGYRGSGLVGVNDGAYEEAALNVDALPSFTMYGWVNANDARGTILQLGNASGPYVAYDDASRFVATVRNADYDPVLAELTSPPDYVVGDDMDFEYYPVDGAPPGWTLRDGAEVVTRETIGEKVHSGLNAVRIQSSGSGVAQGIVKELGTLTPGVEHTVHAWARSPAGPNGQARIAIVKDGVTTLADVPGVAGSVGYELLTAKFVPVSGSTYDLRLLHHASPVPGEVVWFDDVSLWAGNVEIVEKSEWHHVALTVDNQALRASLYVDGIAVANQTMGGPFTKNLTGQTLKVGQGPLGSWNGTIDEVGIVPKALSAKDVMGVYMGGNGAIATQLNVIQNSISNSNTNVTTQINAFQSNVTNQYSSLTGQVNVVQAQVVNQNTNLTTQTNQVLASVANTNTNITTQVNAVSTKITNTQTSINGQTNILNVAINNTASMLGDQYNDLQVQVLNTQLRGHIDASTIAYWAMDEYNGSTLKDAGPMGNDATLVNGPTRVKGVYGSAVRFDGVNDHATFAPNGLIGETGTYTIGFWFKPEQVGGVVQTLVALDGDQLPSVRLQTDRLLLYGASNSYVYGTKTFTAADLNKWWHVVAVIDNPADETTWRIYLNGVNGTGSPATSGSPEPVTATGSMAKNNYYKGALDEVRIVKRAVGADEARAWYDGLAPGVLNQVNTIRADISNSDSTITAQVNYVGTQVNNFESNVTNQVNSVLSSVANTNSNVVTQANTITASLVNQNVNLTNQFNSVMTNIQNRNTNISTQVNSVFSRVENIETNLSSQVNNVRTDITNTNTNINTQVNLIQTHLTNTETNITTQTNLIQAHISNVESNLSSQTNGVNITIQNVNATMLSQFNGVLTTIQNTNLSIQEQTNLIMARVVNEFAARATPYSADDLLAYWSFDEGNGAYAFDLTGNGHDAQALYGEKWVDGKRGTALEFDGHYYGLDLDAAQAEGLSSWDGVRTMSAWVYPTGADEQGGTIITNKNGLGVTKGWMWGIDNSYKLTLSMADGSTEQKVVSSTPLQLNQWSHVVTTYDARTTTTTMWVDGVRAATTGAITMPFQSNNYLRIGGEDVPTIPTLGHEAGWIGRLDEIMIAKRNISDDEARALYIGAGTGIANQFNAITASVSNSNASITNQINAFQSNVTNQYVNLEGQVNTVQAQVVNQNTNLTTQTNQVLASVANTNTNITTQVNAVSVKIDNTQSSLNGQTNLLNVAINNTNASIRDQLNSLSATVQNVGIRPSVDVNTLGYYRFDEGLGVVAEDSGLFQNDGTLQGDASWVQGKYGKAVNVNGNGYVQLPTIDVGESYALSAWVNLSAYNTTMGHAMVISAGLPYLSVRASSPGAVTLSIYNQTNTQKSLTTSSGGFVPLNTWVHLVGVVNAEDQSMAIYVNGVQVAYVAGAEYVSRDPAPTPYSVGAHNNGQYRFHGSIDEARIVDRALSAGEVLAEYNNLDFAVFNQLNSVQVNIQNQNASVTSQLSYANLNVNNSQASVQNQLNTVWGSVNNTNANVASQTNLIASQIVNQNSNITNQVNGIWYTINNSEANISTQMNQVWFTVNNSAANVSTQVNTVQTQVVNQNTNISTQFNLMNNHVTNTETNVTTQVNLLQVAITNLNATVDEQTNTIVTTVQNTNASILAQINALSQEVANSDADIGTQVNLLHQSINNTNSSIHTQVTSLKSLVEFNQNAINVSFVSVESSIAFTRNTILANVTSLNESVQARLLEVLTNASVRSQDALNQTQSIIQNLLESNSTLNNQIVAKAAELVDHVTTRTDAVLAKELEVLQSIAANSTHLNENITNQALNVIGQVNTRSDELVVRSLAVLDNLTAVNTSLSTELLEKSIRIVENVTLRSDDLVNRTLSVLENVTTVDANLTAGIVSVLDQVSARSDEIGQRQLDILLGVAENSTRLNQNISQSTLNVLSNMDARSDDLVNRSLNLLDNLTNVNMSLSTELLEKSIRIVENVTLRSDDLVNRTLRVLENVTTVDANLTAGIVSVLDQVSARSDEIGQRQLDILAGVAENSTRLNQNISQSTLNVLSNMDARSDELVNRSLNLLDNLTNVNASLSTELLEKSIRIVENVTLRSDDLVNRTISVIENVTTVNQSMIDRLVEAEITLLENATRRHDEVVSATLNLTEKLGQVNVSLAETVLSAAVEMEARLGENASLTLNNLANLADRVGYIGNSTIGEYVGAILSNITDDTGSVFESFRTLRDDLNENLTVVNDRLVNESGRISDMVTQLVQVVDVVENSTLTSILYTLEGILVNITQPGNFITFPEDSGLDGFAPASVLFVSASVLKSDEITVSWASQDTGGQVVGVRVYSRRAGEDWALLSNGVGPHGAAGFKGARVGDVVEFKSIATDTNGNQESDPAGDVTRRNFVVYVFKASNAVGGGVVVPETIQQGRGELVRKPLLVPGFDVFVMVGVLVGVALLASRRGVRKG